MTRLFLRRRGERPSIIDDRRPNAPRTVIAGPVSDVVSAFRAALRPRRAPHGTHLVMLIADGWKHTAFFIVFFVLSMAGSSPIHRSGPSSPDASRAIPFLPSSMDPLSQARTVRSLRHVAAVPAQRSLGGSVRSGFASGSSGAPIGRPLFREKRAGRLLPAWFFSREIFPSRVARGAVVNAARR